MAHGYFVTGTDTGVGKTTVAVALIQALRERGLSVAAMKPVAAGSEWVEGEFANADVRALCAAVNVHADRALVNPYTFEPAIAPHIAAAQTGMEIKLETITAAYAALARISDVVVVEGVGGFRVPLSASLDTADLAQALNLPVVLVVGMRLGCLNHALLTAEAIQQRNLRWAGWVANELDPDMPALAENIGALKMRLPMPCLGRMQKNPPTRSVHDEQRAMFSMEWFERLPLVE